MVKKKKTKKKEKKKEKKTYLDVDIKKILKEKKELSRGALFFKRREQNE